MIPPAIAAAPIRIRPEIGMLNPAKTAIDPGDDGEDAAPDPATDDLARLLGEPAARDDVGLERAVEVGDVRAELRQLVRA